jgi:aspartyl-tRNA(Asn)/glutamyl-tRNA(Gln) amidotransferase subunit A
VVDAVLVDAAARGMAAPAVRRGGLTGLHVIVPTTLVLDACDAAVIANFESSVARLAATGATIERRAFPVFEEIMALSARHVAIVNAEAYALHKERVEGEDAKRMDRRVAARIAMGNKAPLTAYVAILEARRRLVAQVAAELQGHVVVAMPSVAHVAPSIAALEADDDLFVRTNLKTLRNTLLGNFLDWCGVSIPNGTDAEGMPTGFLLSGPPGGDEHLLSVSMAAEEIVRGGA